MTELNIPLGLAELLHATLGPLSEILHEEGHPWAQVVKQVLDTYTGARNRALMSAHGSAVLPEIAHATFLAAEKVCALTDRAVREQEDFIQWAAEVDGSSH